MPPSRDAKDELLQAILHRAKTDVEFRKRLLTAPAEAIEENFGVRIPHGYRIRFIEKGEDVDALIVLPARGESEELSEDELDQVAGGVQTHTMWAGQIHEE